MSSPIRSLIPSFRFCTRARLEPLLDKQTGLSRWRDAERLEFKQLWDLKTFNVISEIPSGETIYSTKIVWKLKPGINGEDGRAKARLCVRNFKTDVNDEVFAPVCRIEAVRMLMSELAVHPDWTMCHVDVCNAFCTAPLEKPIYIHPPEGMIQDDPTLAGKFLQVNNALYGLACSPRAFNQHLHKRLESYGWNASPVDHCLYTRTDSHGTSFVLCYVDDLLAIGCDTHITEFRKKINVDTNPDSGFKVRDYGPPTSFLGIYGHRTQSAHGHIVAAYIHPAIGRTVQGIRWKAPSYPTATWHKDDSV